MPLDRTKFFQESLKKILLATTVDTVMSAHSSTLNTPVSIMLDLLVQHIRDLNDTNLQLTMDLWSFVHLTVPSDCLFKVWVFYLWFDYFNCLIHSFFF